MSVEPILGVSLEQHAGVVAAVAEGFPLEQVLVAEQLDPASWRGADVAWRQRLAKDGLAGGSTFNTYRAKLEDAGDCMSRAVTPLDDDLPAWLSFLDHWSKSGDPSGMLKQHSLGVNDVSRLQRRWAKRLDDDPNLALAAAKLAAQGPAPLPKITVAAPQLRPFPWSKRRGPAATMPQISTAAGGPLPEDFPLDRYARVSAELAALPQGRAQVFERHGLSERSFVDVDQSWQASLANSAELAADFRRLVAHHRARLDAASQVTSDRRPERAANQAVVMPPVLATAQPTSEPLAALAPAPSVAISNDLNETAMSLAVLDDDVLPFQADPNKAFPPLANLGPNPDAGETSYATPALRDDSLAFFRFAPLAPNIDETAAMPAIAIEEALPFHGEFAVVAHTPLSPDEHALAGETGDLGVDLLGDLDASFPFQPASSAALPARERYFSGLTIQQVAAVAVELTLAPDQRAAIFALYRLSEESVRAAFDAVNEQRLSNPAVRAEWEQAYAAYDAYCASRAAR